MKRKLLSLLAISTVCLSMIAADFMIVTKRNGETIKVNVEDVYEVYFESVFNNDTSTIVPSIDPSIVDTSATPLKFEITSDSTVEVARDEEHYYSSLDSVNIPSKVKIDGKIYDVTSIEWGAFYDCSSLESITIPNGVTSIEWGAFYGCSSLESITIPESVTNIEDWAFNRCDKLTPQLLIYNNGTKCYGWVGAKDSCTNIVIPEGVTSIGAHAFEYCINLTNIVIPETVTNIDSVAFGGCVSLTSIKIPNGITELGFATFRGCESLESVELPESLTIIGGHAFEGCSSMDSITIPNGVTSIEWEAFYGCSSLESITIPNGVTSIEWGAFSGCSSLESITILEGVTSIGDYAFSDCSSLKSIAIPESVTSIGWRAFDECRNLDVVIENSEENVEVRDYAFSDVKSVTWLKNDPSIVYASSIPLHFNILTDSTVEVARDEENYYSSLDSVNIPSKVKIEGKVYDVTSIGDYAFVKCGNLASITIPESVTSIKDYAFYGCSGLTSITIPESVTSIGDAAFWFCDNLDVVIDNAEENVEVGSSAFQDCKSVTWLKNDPSIVYASSIPLYFNILTDSTVEVAGYSKNYNDDTDTVLIIPDKVMMNRSLYTVTRIGDHGIYKDGYNLRHIEIPSSVMSIGAYAFAGCSSLYSITIPEGVTSIGESAFDNCSSLESITIPVGVTSIGESAFASCSSLESITIPESVTSIGAQAFSNCKNLDVVIDNAEENVEVGSSTFSGVKSVTYTK